jgi:transposase
MIKRRYKTGVNRDQAQLFPARVEDYVSPGNRVRAIDAYVATVDLSELLFSKTESRSGRGQPSYDPEMLLKLYLYGYQQGIRSSRKLEQETHRNLEVIWLMTGLRPCYKTIADFRKENARGLREVNRDFVLLCRELSLLGGEEVAVDGSFFKADARKGSIYTGRQLSKQLEALEAKIKDYQDAISAQDQRDDEAGLGQLVEDAQLQEKLERLQQRQAEKQALKKQLDAGDAKQISTVDEDARLLKKRGQSTAGYNVQIAVDDKHKLIVASEVTQDGNDHHQLSPMLEQAQEVLQSDKLTGLADSGYYDGDQLKICEENQITVYVAVPDSQKVMKKRGYFTLDEFTYDAEQDCYICPQGQALTPYGKPFQNNNKWRMRYASKVKDCRVCPSRGKCFSPKSARRQIQRWEHEEVIERHKARMKQAPETMKKRGALVEHPFGVLKHRAGMHHFLMRGLEKCQGEFSLMVSSYNLTRVLNLIGIETFIACCELRR